MALEEIHIRKINKRFQLILFHDNRMTTISVKEDHKFFDLVNSFFRAIANRLFKGKV